MTAKVFCHARGFRSQSQRAEFAIWEIAGRHSTSFSFLLGTPSVIALELKRMLLHEQLAWHFFVTGIEALVGLAAGTLIGLAFGLSLWFSDRAAQVSRPFVIVFGFAFRSLPLPR